ncbi:hypothetical protein V6K52_03445 [Knoellia sp. S7-12]|uniref:hypothetical protein n=1 Tax=Knoellia sp. S7-12 TaxID=3126698 RepID=UPI003367BFD6
MPDDDKAGPQRLVRFFFPLPSPLPVPDGWSITEAPGVGAPPPGPLAHLIFWQHEESAEAMGESMKAVLAVRDRVSDGQIEGTGSGREWLATRRVTVVEAITQADAKATNRDGWDGEPQNLAPEQDFLVRCITLAAQVVRAFRLVQGDPLQLPTYEGLPPHVLLSFGEGELNRQGSRLPAPADWTPQALMMLNHMNIAFDLLPKSAGADELRQSGFWMHALQTGAPGVLAREQLQLAGIAMDWRGEYAEAVVKANTASEVLLDSTLSLLAWEEHLQDDTKPTADEWGLEFVEGQLRTRVAHHLTHRLKGDWTSTSSPYVRWLRGGHALRHRIVHGAYAPSRQEAADALCEVAELHTHVFDRICERRNFYPRAAIMSVGQEGLERRDLLRGRIVRFLTDIADTEDPWSVAWGMWHQRLITVASDAR